MQIAFDKQYANEVGEHFGRYRATFVSDGGQVIAHLFEEGDGLIAYVYVERGLKPEDVTDDYLSPLNRYAREQGFGERLSLRYT